MLLAKSRRRKERQQKDPLCDSASWRETVFRISVVSVSGVSREESGFWAAGLFSPAIGNPWQGMTYGSAVLVEMRSRFREDASVCIGLYLQAASNELSSSYLPD
jgi:hypothetical protein